MGEEDDKPIRVVDRRMFTPEGELRPDFEPEEPAPPPPRAAAAGEASEAPRAAPAPEATEPGPSGRTEPEGGAPGEPRSEFARIVSSLATTAYSALGLLADPAAGAVRRDLAVARQMIDWLGVLEQKTRGNLSFEESDLLSRVLYELRLAYVEVGRGPR
ncbi:MAG TPA: DUF1844 domain-containing protein [Thermoanaerobaculia bacterium]